VIANLESGTTLNSRDVVSVLKSRSRDGLETQFQTSRSRLGLVPQRHLSTKLFYPTFSINGDNRI